MQVPGCLHALRCVQPVQLCLNLGKLRPKRASRVKGPDHADIISVHQVGGVLAAELRECLGIVFNIFRFFCFWWQLCQVNGPQDFRQEAC